MKIPYFCCIGAELKRYAQDFDFMNQVYLYKVPTDDTIEEVFAQDYFQAVATTVLQDDILYIYEPTTQVLYTCRFNKQNGHITAEQMANNIPALTPNKILISDEDGKITAGNLSLEDIVVKISTETQVMQGGLQTPELETDTLTVDGAATFEEAPTTNDTTTYQNATTDSLIRKEQVDEVVQDIKTSSLTFIGYVSATEPSSATYAFNTGDLWLNSATMPTTFPFPQANIKEWNGSAWVAHSQDYTPANFEFFRNMNDNEGYYWFGGEWVVMSTDMSTTYFQLNPISGKWEIKSNVNLPGAPTTTTPSTDDNSTKIATTAFVKNALNKQGSGRNIGDIFFTIRNDNGLNGAVECNGATYNTTDFTGVQSIGALLVAGKIPYVSLADYATALATNGSVGVFGWDGTNTTAFRVPLLNDIFVETGTAAQIGDYLEPGLPDHTHTVSTYDSAYPFSGGTYGGLTSYKNRVTSPASESNPIYGNSTTVQPNAVRYRAMVQLAVSTTDEALETCTSVLADVAALKYDYVVVFQAPTAQNNYTWYRKYKSGWVEQGGILSVGSSSQATATLPITMSDTNYTITNGFQDTSGTKRNDPVMILGATTTEITMGHQAGATMKCHWLVCGMAAS